MKPPRLTEPPKAMSTSQSTTSLLPAATNHNRNAGPRFGPDAREVCGSKRTRPASRRQPAAVGGECQDGQVASDARMVALGFGKFARADRIFALERISGEERGDGRRTRVWVDGIAGPVIASRTEVTILRDMGQEAAAAGPELEEALDLAARLAAAADAGRVDLGDLGRRARRLLASTTGSAE